MPVHSTPSAVAAAQSIAAGGAVGPGGDGERQQQERSGGLAAGGHRQWSDTDEVTLRHAGRDAIGQRRNQRRDDGPAAAVSAEPGLRAREPQHSCETDPHADPLQQSQPLAQPYPGDQCCEQWRGGIQDRCQAGRDRQDRPGEQRERYRRVDRAEQHEPRRRCPQFREITAQRQQRQQHQRRDRHAQFGQSEGAEGRHRHAGEEKARAPECGEQDEIGEVAAFHDAIVDAPESSGHPLLAVNPACRRFWFAPARPVQRHGVRNAGGSGSSTALAK